FLKENGTATILPLHINGRNALNTLSNPKVPLHTRTKRSQRLLIIRSLIALKWAFPLRANLSDTCRALDSSPASRHDHTKATHVTPERNLMRYLQPKLLVLAATSLPVAAHADTIDDFTLTF